MGIFCPFFFISFYFRGAACAFFHRRLVAGAYDERRRATCEPRITHTFTQPVDAILSPGGAFFRARPLADSAAAAAAAEFYDDDYIIL